MIKTERQYQQARLKCQEGQEQLQHQIAGMKERGYEDHEIECLTGCTIRMLDESRRAIDLYRRLKGKDPHALGELPLNRQLIGLRIFLGLSQAKLAARLGISRSEVARDEKNEYRGLTLERHQQLLEVMGLKLVPAYVEGDWQDAAVLREELVQTASGKTATVIIG
ncbi:MAG: helix-turn-helix transcriptional regulator [Syntrophomonadaceae bacterium]